MATHLFKFLRLVWCFAFLGAFVEILLVPNYALAGLAIYYDCSIGGEVSVSYYPGDRVTDRVTAMFHKV